MKVRSKALYAYLLDAGVLNGTPEEIDMVKRDYRRLYKKQWRQAKRPRKEIRIEVTIQQFEAIKAKANIAGMPHTTYVRLVTVASLQHEPPLRCEPLLEILQLVSMATIATSHDRSLERIHNMVAKAETLLLQFIKRI